MDRDDESVSPEEEALSVVSEDLFGLLEEAQSEFKARGYHGLQCDYVLEDSKNDSIWLINREFNRSHILADGKITWSSCWFKDQFYLKLVGSGETVNIPFPDNIAISPALLCAFADSIPILKRGLDELVKKRTKEETEAAARKAAEAKLAAERAKADAESVGSSAKRLREFLSKGRISND